MAILAPMTWEIRPSTGNANNGGGFDPTSGTPGTDYSQQDAPRVAFTDLVIDAVTNTNCTSILTPFTADMVGNVINILSGTGFTVQRVQIISITAGVATMDKSLGTTSSVGGTGNLGGALVSINLMNSSLPVAGNTIWIKKGSTITLTTNLNVINGTVVAPVHISAYTTVRGDMQTLNPAIYQTNGFFDSTKLQKIEWSAGTNRLNSGNFNYFSGFFLEGTNDAGEILTLGTNATIHRVKVLNDSVNSAGQAVTSASLTHVLDCEFSTVGVAGSAVAAGSITGLFNGVRMTSTNGGGFSTSQRLTLFHCLFYSFAASQVAIKFTAAVNDLTIIINCTFDNVPGTIVQVPNLAVINPLFVFYNNIISNSGVFADNLRTATQALTFFSGFNNIWNTTTYFNGWSPEAKSIADITTSDNTVYVNEAGGDYRLATVSSARGTGAPPGVSQGAMQQGTSSGSPSTGGSTIVLGG